MPELAELLAAAEAPIAVADRQRVRFVILNRPQARNALTRAMRVEFAALLRQAQADPEIEALVLTGAGGCFSGGVDLKDRIAGAPPVEPNPGAAIRALSKPIVAAVDGACITGALEMALSCSFALATPEAYFADTHCKIGLFPRWGGGALLTSAVGARRARQMMLAGERIDAATALAWGLVNELQPQARLLERAAQLAAAMAARAAAQPLAYQLHVEMLNALQAAPSASEVESRLLARFDARRAGIGAP
jgi:enoyl-CoA hydratase